MPAKPAAGPGSWSARGTGGAARSISAQCCIVGGGPAGMMLGYLMARAGVDTVVLEKHADFLRDFRGDTVHPSTMQVMDDLGLLDAFLKRPHQKLPKLAGVFGNSCVQMADFTRLNLKARFIALMPQWDFLDFLFDAGAHYPNLKVLRKTEVLDLLRDGETVTGVVARTESGRLDVQASLTVGCDGRHSVVRECAGLEIEDVGAPIDVLWFKVSKDPAETDQTLMNAEPGCILVTLDRGDYWQCAYVIAKGQADAVKARGIEQFRKNIASTAPKLEARIGEVKSWDDVKLLTVSIDRLKRWTRPGLLCIGDAAHAMSPIGGVGINLAIQDAVATANILSDKLSNGCPDERVLDRIRKRRLFPVRATQALQVQMQNRIISRALQGGPLQVPFFMRVITQVPWLQGLTARVFGLGFRPEHVRSKIAAIS
ncbi:MAG: FAD-dependent oxidoreductase [Pseudomonadota bacterium]